jgi:diaminohydroxyphosphoribosylaminopyrimidine deaminase/5-amino-6-(5-phosphoribosylamino)uracil reductase
MSSNPNDDRKYMMMALTLARRAEGRTAPNPMVGAVVIDRHDNIVGDGHHEACGKAHAEAVALERAGEKAAGGTLYVTLEPCCHHGRTPPCTDRVVASGVRRVVMAMVDPNPLVAGGGVKLLEDKGITVTQGVLEAEARWLNRGFVSRVTKGRPWVCLKLATTLDGKIADRFGTSKYISGPEALAHVHELRNRLDCVLVGGRTAELDDPSLNVRDTADSRDPLRVVLDSGKAPQKASSKLFSSETGGRTLILTSSQLIKTRYRQTLPEHVRVIAVETDLAGDKVDVGQALRKLAEEGINTVLCEGGGRLAGALLNAKLVDEVHWIVAPKVLGDAEGAPAVSMSKVVPLTEILSLKSVSMRQLGSDMLITGLIEG